MTDIKPIHFPMSPMAEFEFPNLEHIDQIKKNLLDQVTHWIPHNNNADWGETGWVNSGLTPVYHADLFDWIETCVTQFRDLYLKGVELKFVDAWIHRCQFGQEGNFHKHVNSMVSGVFYFDDHTTGLEFKYANQIEQHWSSLTLNPDTPLEPHRFTVPSRQGKLILFDSNLKHRVLKNKSLGKPRYSLAFNLFAGQVTPTLSAGLVYDIKDVRARHLEYLASQQDQDN